MQEEPQVHQQSSARVRALAAPAEALHQLARRSFIKRAVAGGVVLGAGVALPVGRLLPAGAARLQDGELPDATVAQFLQTFELAAAEAEELAAERLDNREWAELLARFAEHHRDHGEAIGSTILVQDEATAGDAEPNEEVLSDLRVQVRRAADDQAILEVARELEETLASTYYEVVGTLAEASDARNIGLILPIEAQHAVAIATALEEPPDSYLFAFQGASPFEPAEITEPPAPDPEEQPGEGGDDSATTTTTTPS